MNRRGFSLIELIAVVGITIVIGTVAFIYLGGRQGSAQLDMVVSQVVASLRQAQQNAIASASSTPWGVRFDNGSGGGGTLSDGLVGHWEMNEGSGSVAGDSSPTNADGSISGTPSWQASGNCQAAGCLAFNGSDNRINVPHDAALNPTSQMTIAGWFYMGATGGIGVNKESQYRLMAADVSANRASIRYATNSTNWSSGTLAGDTTLSLNTWYHIAATYDGANWRLYVNGAQDGIRAETGTLVTSSNGFYIGNYGGGGYFWNGRIDDVRVYNRSLTAGEIADLASGVGGSSFASFSTFASSSWSQAAVTNTSNLPSRVLFSTSSVPQDSVLDVIFAQGTGRPLSTSSIVLRTVSGSEARQIDVSTLGVVTVSTTTAP